MRQLNENGVSKVVVHLSKSYGVKAIIGQDQDGYFIELEDLDITAAGTLPTIMESINVKMVTVNGRMRLMVEDISAKPAVTSTSAAAEDNIKTAADEEAKKNGFDMNNKAMIAALVEKMLPELSKLFPTKEQVNAALNALKRDSVQDKQLAGGLEDLTKSVQGQPTV